MLIFTDRKVRYSEVYGAISPAKLKGNNLV